MGAQSDYALVIVAVVIPIAVTPVTPAIAVVVTAMPTIIAVAPAPAVVTIMVAVAAPEAAVIPIVVAVAAPEAAVSSLAALAHTGKLSPVMLGLGTEEAVAPDIALELALFAADIAATAVLVTRLRGRARQRDSTQQHHPAQSRTQ